MSANIRVRIYCGLYVGPTRWQAGFDAYEPDECCWETVIEIAPQTWIDDWRDYPPPYKCGGCGQQLEDANHFERETPPEPTTSEWLANRGIGTDEG